MKQIITKKESGMLDPDSLIRIGKAYCSRMISIPRRMASSFTGIR